MEPIVIGNYREIGNEEYTPIRECLSEFPIPEKAEVLRYLKTAPVTAVSPEMMRDVFTENRIQGTLRMYCDGVYAWRSDAIYYFEKYNMTLPDEFIAHVMKHNN